MKKAATYPLLLIMLLALCIAAAGCLDERQVGDELMLPKGLQDELQDELQKEGVLEEIKAVYEEFKVALQELFHSTPRLAHDQNLKTIDQAIDLFKLTEGKDPKGIGKEGEKGTLVGEGYLESNPPIPHGLREDAGQWSEYKLKGKPLRTWPVGDWGGYRDGDKP